MAFSSAVSDGETKPMKKIVKKVVKKIVRKGGEKRLTPPTAVEEGDVVGQLEKKQRSTSVKNEKSKKKLKPEIDSEILDMSKFENPDLVTAKKIRQTFRSGDKVKHNAHLSRKLKREMLVEQKGVEALAKRDAILNTEQEGILEAGDDRVGESTHHYRQKQILENVDIGTQEKGFNFDLPYGKYYLDYTPNGRHLLFGGAKGEIALLDTQTMESKCEINVKETVRCVKTFHNDDLFAVSQKKCVYIYDNQGVEIHQMKEHALINSMDFLKYHFLLVTGSDFGDLRYHDIATGSMVCRHKTRKGPIKVMKQNKQNAVMHIGQANGVVSLWTPNIKEPVLEVLTHKGPVHALNTYKDYLTTSGGDGKWKVFDLRKPDQHLHSFTSYGRAINNIDISQTGLIGMATGPRVQIYQGKSLWNSSSCCGTPYYMTQDYFGTEVNDVAFQPFQDILAVGTGKGIGSMIVPGAGIANYDSYEANPFETKKQKRETEVRNLLEKLKPDMITFNHNGLVGAHRIGNFKRELPKNVDSITLDKDHQNAKDIDEDSDDSEDSEFERTGIRLTKSKKKARGKNKIAKRLKKKEVAHGKERKAKMEENEKLKRVSGDANGDNDVNDNSGSDVDVAKDGALARFKKHRRRLEKNT